MFQTVFLAVCVSSAACLSARVAHLNVIACARLAGSARSPLSGISGNSNPLFRPLHPADVAFKRISPSAITVVQKCQLFWVPDSARLGVPGCSLLFDCSRAAHGCQVPGTATAGRIIIIGCQKSRPQANIGQLGLVLASQTAKQ